jgi:hypothetical protein
VLSRELGVEAQRLAAWRDDFLEGGKQSLKGQRPDRSPEDGQLRDAERKIGQLTMDRDLAGRGTRGLSIPPVKRPREPWTTSCHWPWSAGSSTRPFQDLCPPRQVDRHAAARTGRPISDRELLELTGECWRTRRWPARLRQGPGPAAS